MLLPDSGTVSFSRRRRGQGDFKTWLGRETCVGRNIAQLWCTLLVKRNEQNTAQTNIHFHWFHGLEGYDFTTLPHVTLKNTSQAIPIMKITRSGTNHSRPENLTRPLACHQKRSSGIQAFGAMCRLVSWEKNKKDQALRVYTIIHQGPPQVVDGIVYKK